MKFPLCPRSGPCCPRSRAASPSLVGSYVEWGANAWRERSQNASRTDVRWYWARVVLRSQRHVKYFVLAPSVVGRWSFVVTATGASGRPALDHAIELTRKNRAAYSSQRSRNARGRIRPGARGQNPIRECATSAEASRPARRSECAWAAAKACPARSPRPSGEPARRREIDSRWHVGVWVGVMNRH